MRKSLITSTNKIFKKFKKSFLLLGDIGVFGFRKLLKEFPNRAKNFGILEQSMISFAAGLSKLGFIPIIHTIAPFLVNRGFEQIKIDFGYQELKGKFVTIGGSYDYAALGCTHHCPEDVNLMANIPNMQIVIPGNSKEFEEIFIKTFNYDKPFYFKLSDQENRNSFKVKFGKINHLRKGKELSLILVGPVLNFINFNELEKFNLNIIYITTLRPLDEINLKKINKNISKFILIEPFYSAYLILKLQNLFKKKIQIKNISVPYKFLNNYGTKDEHDNKIGFNMKNLIKEINNLIEK